MRRIHIFLVLDAAHEVLAGHRARFVVFDINDAEVASRPTGFAAQTSAGGLRSTMGLVGTGLVGTVSSDKTSSTNDNVVAHFGFLFAEHVCIIAFRALSINRFFTQKLRFCVGFLQLLVAD